MVRVNIKNLEANALVDTGAACSIVNARAAGQKRWQSSERKIATANASLLATTRVVHLKIYAGENEGKQLFGI